MPIKHHNKQLDPIHGSSTSRVLIWVHIPAYSFSEVWFYLLSPPGGSWACEGAKNSSGDCWPSWLPQVLTLGFLWGMILCPWDWANFKGRASSMWYLMENYILLTSNNKLAVTVQSMDVMAIKYSHLTYISVSGVSISLEYIPRKGLFYLRTFMHFRQSLWFVPLIA